eukprot:CFRG7439T1
MITASDSANGKCRRERGALALALAPAPAPAPAPAGMERTGATTQHAMQNRGVVGIEAGGRMDGWDGQEDGRTRGQTRGSEEVTGEE